MSKVVLITGCSTGIGRDFAQRLASSGYIVVATARKADTLADLSVVMKLPLDVTQSDSVCEAVAITLQQFGRIDVLVNNAGYTMQGALEEVSEEQTQQVFDVNVFGALRMIALLFRRCEISEADALSTSVRLQANCPLLRTGLIRPRSLRSRLSATRCGWNWRPLEFRLS